MTINSKLFVLYSSFATLFAIANDDFSITINNTKIIVVKGNLLNQKVDAIVNAANNQLQHAGGIAAAIVKQGGPIIQEESNKIVKNGFLPIGSAYLTRAGKLPFKYIIHAIGPNCNVTQQAANKVQLLSKAYQNSLALAQASDCTSIGFCSISTDIFGYNINEATPVAIRAIVDWVQANPATKIKEIRLVIFDQNKDAAEHVQLYTENLKKWSATQRPFAEVQLNQIPATSQFSSDWSKILTAQILIPITFVTVTAAAIAFGYYKCKKQQVS